MDETMPHEDLPFLYQSEELSDASRRSFEGHLSSCAECRAALGSIGWAADLAHAAAITPEPSLARRALLSSLGTPAPAWSWADWGSSAGMGFGLAFAVGLFLFRSSHPATDALSWRSGLTAEISELSGRLDGLDTDLSVEAWNVEFNDGMDELRRGQQGLQRQLARPEGV